MSRSEGQSFSVLVVCHANLCRSPLVEHLLQEQIRCRELPWRVSSTGTDAVEGRPMHRHAARVLRNRGHHVHDWVTRTLTSEDIDAADLVLAATQRERETVHRLSPGSIGRTHTLLQLAYLTSASPVLSPVPTAGFGPWLLESAAQARTRVQPLPPSRRDLPDPIGRLYPAFLTCAARIERSLDQILAPAPQRHWDWLTAGTSS